MTIPEEVSVPAGILLPNYRDGSIANIAPTLARMLTIPFEGLDPLKKSHWEPLGKQVKRVVLIVIDGFGKNLLTPPDPYIDSFLQKADVVDHITSVFPSTTVNAMSAIWTGSAPAHHGLVGLNMLFPKYGAIGQTIHWTPAYQFIPDSLVKAGENPKHFLKAPGVGRQFYKGGVPVYSLKSYQFERSALSRMHGRGVKQSFPCIDMSDIIFETRELLENNLGKRLCAVAYWHTVDTLSHKYGPHHPAVRSDLRSILRMIEEELIDSLSPTAKENTVVIITGDHGQAHTPLEKVIHYQQDEEIESMLMMRPAGEPRAPYFFARQGAVDDLMDYLKGKYPQEMWPLVAEEALSMGLYGPEPHLDEVRRRIGDVVGIMRENYTYKLPKDAERGFLGTHGSLTPDEMEIAWIGRRLDK